MCTHVLLLIHAVINFVYYISVEFPPPNLCGHISPKHQKVVAAECCLTGHPDDLAISSVQCRSGYACRRDCLILSDQYLFASTQD